MKNTDTVPRHVAIIPDGNRRWAHEQGLKSWEGHERGAQRIEEIVNIVGEKGITHLSLWGASRENLTKRPLAEKKELLRIYEEYFLRLINRPEVMDEAVRINVVGSWREQFPQSLVTILEDGIERTKDNSGPVFSFFLAYSGDHEMLSAIKSIIDDGVHTEDLTKEVLKKYLMTYDLPAVDYLIRTGGEPHLSTGFMMWDTANAQLYFTDAYFPDFDASAFEEALDEYAQRARRHGA